MILNFDTMNEKNIKSSLANKKIKENKKIIIKAIGDLENFRGKTFVRFCNSQPNA